MPPLDLLLPLKGPVSQPTTPPLMGWLEALRLEEPPPLLLGPVLIAGERSSAASYTKRDD
jgi:hypothetical protein